MPGAPNSRCRGLLAVLIPPARSSFPERKLKSLFRTLTLNEFAGVARASQIGSRLRRGVPTGEPYYDENPEHYERQRQAVLASFAATGQP